MDKAAKKPSNDRRNEKTQHVKNGTANSRPLSQWPWANWSQTQAQPKPLMNLNSSEVS